MSLVTMKCPSCGGTLELDDTREFGFCIYCGTKVRVQDEKARVEVSGSVKFDETDKYKNCLNLANEAYVNGNINEAYKYYTKALEIKQSEYLPIFRKGLCAGYLSSDNGLRVEEVVSGVSHGFDMAPDKNAQKDMSEEIVTFVVNHKPPQDTDFYSSDDCARYVKAVYSRANLLNRLYRFVDQENVDDVITYIEAVLDCCQRVNSSVMKFSAGTSVKKGKAETVYGTYPVPQNITHEMADLNKKFTVEYNKFIEPRVKRAEQEVENIKKKIDALPVAQKIAHFVCNWWVFLLGLILCVNAGSVGIWIWIIQLILLVAAKVTGKNNNAKSLYAELKTKKKELAALKKQLKK
ncbi:hypothetical protein [uncultured Gemmiger sp.]|uniref:hypothetical protein n=1 Tax=uncultured Gemmiger sp. TaxID=1623490 RepID=UPI00263A0FB5|nr:hypothetical protein [uncultured Gemmiger sp.]